MTIYPGDETTADLKPFITTIIELNFFWFRFLIQEWAWNARWGVLQILGNVVQSFKVIAITSQFEMALSIITKVLSIETIGK